MRCLRMRLLTKDGNVYQYTFQNRRWHSKGGTKFEPESFAKQVCKDNLRIKLLINQLNIV